MRQVIGKQSNSISGAGQLSRKLALPGELPFGMSWRVAATH